MRDQHVYLNGISLTDAHPLILLQHISEGAAELDVSTADRAGAPGAFVHGIRLKRRQITVEFAVRERLDFAKRAEAVSAAAAWARPSRPLSAFRHGRSVTGRIASLRRASPTKLWKSGSASLCCHSQIPMA